MSNRLQLVVVVPEVEGSMRCPCEVIELKSGSGRNECKH